VPGRDELGPGGDCERQVVKPDGGSSKTVGITHCQAHVVDAADHYAAPLDARL
jgi:hypothetical protein